MPYYNPTEMPVGIWIYVISGSPDVKTWVSAYKLFFKADTCVNFIGIEVERPPWPVARPDTEYIGEPTTQRQI